MDNHGSGSTELQYSKFLVYFEKWVRILFDVKHLKVNVHDKLSRVNAKRREVECVNPK